MANNVIQLYKLARTFTDVLKWLTSNVHEVAIVSYVAIWSAVCMV